MRVLHLITGLEAHGAERMMARLIASTPGCGVSAVVVSLTGDGPVADELRAHGVEVVALEIGKAAGLVRGPAGVAAAIRRYEPDVVQTWLYDADLIGALTHQFLARGTPVVWNLRQTVPDLTAVKPRTRWVVRARARLSSRAPARIVCCAPEVLDSHVAFGYDARQMVVIPNGTDTTTFVPDRVARREVRDEIGVAEDIPLVGLVARVAPQKDHATFTRAAALVVSARPNAHFVLCGQGADANNQELADLLRASGLDGHVTLLGSRADIPRVTACFDIALSTSAFGEGYPNSIAEALASGVPCVATDVGHSSSLVGGAGRMVPAGDFAAVAQAVLELLDLPKASRRRAR